ncbi:hypothetical protein [Nonomuraea recticatena]|uniref:GntR family transcriptional regulator n=1 Tax=Nonomuraea recticatena TaxID=46178 RepID=A0ABN3SG19_9ACTN
MRTIRRDGWDERRGYAFEEIAAELLGAIEAGDYHPGAQLPGLRARRNQPL